MLYNVSNVKTLVQTVNSGNIHLYIFYRCTTLQVCSQVYSPVSIQTYQPMKLSHHILPGQTLTRQARRKLLVDILEPAIYHISVTSQKLASTIIHIFRQVHAYARSVDLFHALLVIVRTSIL